MNITRWLKRLLARSATKAIVENKTVGPTDNLSDWDFMGKEGWVLVGIANSGVDMRGRQTFVLGFTRTTQKP
jgi:hypothetical protein